MSGTSKSAPSSLLWTPARSAACSLLLAARATLHILHHVAGGGVWLVAVAGGALLTLILQLMRVALWLVYYALRAPLCVVLQCVDALLWLVRLTVGGVHFVLFAAIPSVFADVKSIVGSVVHLACVLVCLAGLGICVALSLSCHSMTLFLGLGYSVARNILELSSRVFGPAALPMVVWGVR